VSTAAGQGAGLAVLRVFHSAVVGEWRNRDRALQAEGVDEVLVSPRRWNEGGREVALDCGTDTFVVPAATVGSHPYVFVYDPRPIWRALRSRTFDVIDVHEEPASLAAAEVMVLARLAGQRAPVCLYGAQNIEKRFPPPFHWIERATLRRAAGVHTCNQEAGAILRRKGFSGRIRDLGLGVDLVRFAPPDDSTDGASGPAGDGSASGDGRALRVGYVGRLEPHKGVEVLVAAVAATPGTELEIVGGGPSHAAVAQAVARSGVSDRVRLTGFVAPDELAGIYRRFDVVAVPSLETPSWIEQFGRVAVEAMASGVAVVASDSGSLPEVVADAGILVPPGDVGALAGALERLRDRPEERTRLGGAGRRRAARYGWDQVAARQLELYRSVVEDRS
jgi:glycosyltransferase involved in cell wall biosynthesis